MSATVHDLLEKHFETAFAAPDGIAKLRELILTLAMQGKLVEQDPNDPPASALLKEIEAEKQRLIKEGKIKKPRPLPPIKPEEVPYELPQGWEWVRIREICHDWGQKTPDATFTYIDVGSIDSRRGAISDNTQILNSSEAPSRARKIVKRGTVIYSTVRPYLLNIAIIEKEYKPEPIASTAFAILHPFASLSPRFIYHYLRSPTFIRYVESTQKGVAYPAINDGDFFSGLFPLPPLLEQHRIVERIDQLMARCDALEKLRKEREEKRLAVHAAAIRQLLDPAPSAPLKPESESSKAPTVSYRGGDEASASAWRFIRQHFGELYAVKENVAELRKAILQLAVMGRLVPQDPNDPPASELLKEIEAEKQRQIKEGKIKKPKPLPPIKPEEVPYELPVGWEWVRLIEIGTWALGSGLPHNIQGDTGQEILLCKVSDMNLPCNEKFISTTKNTVSLDVAQQHKLNISEPGTIIFPKIGGAIATNKRRILQNKTVIDNNCLGIKPSSMMNLEWCYQLLQSFDFSKYQTGTSVPAISQGTIGKIIIGLPPIPEQHRIVKRIDQLMALCDRLEQQIDAATGKQTELLDAVMAQV